MQPILLPERIQKAIDALPSLPTLPTVASRVVSMAGDEKAAFQSIAEEIEKDPALASSFLKVANSSYYRTPYGVSNVMRALVVLGSREVRRICLGVSVMSVFPPDPAHPRFDRVSYWRHSGACAVACRSLAERLKIQRDGEEFTAGLLHAVGKLLLDLLFHEKYSEVIEISFREGIGMGEAEKRILGTTHGEAGAWLCQRWKFPERLVDTVRWHHQPERAEVDPVLAALVNLGDTFARVRGSGFGGERVPVVLRETAAWRILAASWAKEKDLDLERITFELGEEMEKHRDMYREAL